MTLHIFNPEHDIALAANLANFTAPHAGRQLRADLDYLPALWAQPGDVILTDHPDHAMKYWQRLAARLHVNTPLSFVTSRGGSVFQQTDILPWGWDKALRGQLQRSGFNKGQLPDDVLLEHIRQLSHRRMVAQLLPLLRMEGTVGEAFECDTVEHIGEFLGQYGQIVVKAPWSSSGRGVRFLDGRCMMDDGSWKMEEERWLISVIERQGSVMVEPCYRKVCDFGMEFEAAPQGISYVGLSLFQTVNGAYTGNILATETVKRGILGRYVPLALIDAVVERVVGWHGLDGYAGPFGIDMMVVANSDCRQGYLLHPCVEINVRRTMGHVALVLERLANPSSSDDFRKVMRVYFDGSHYKFSIRKF